MEIFSVAIAYSRCMPDSIVIRGSRGSLYRALLHLVHRWVSANGLPEHYAVTSARSTNSLVVTSDSLLVDYIRHEMPALWRAARANLAEWPDGPAPLECPTIELIR